MLGELLGCRNVGQEPLVDMGPVDNRNSGSVPVFGSCHDNAITVLPNCPQLLVDQQESPLPFAPLGLSPAEDIARTNGVNGLGKTVDEEITYIITALNQGIS